MAQQNQEYLIGTVYRIKSPSSDRVYIGSTTQSLSSRMSKHKADFLDYIISGGKYISSFEILALNNAVIENLGIYECDDIAELRRFEQMHMEEAGNNLVNRNRAVGIQGPERHRIYRAENHAAIHARRSVRQVCVCGGSFAKSGRASHYKTRQHNRWVAENNNLA